MPTEIPDFRKGRQVTRGVHTPTEPFHVTVVRRHEAKEFFNARTDAELRRHLRGLRDLGLLVHDEGRLTQAVRVGERERIAAYVVKGRASGVPRRRKRERVLKW